jgi:hypothetical protein
MLRAPFPLHTCHRQYPGAAIAGTTLLFSRNDLSLPRIDWQVGPHITLFEACSAFTHVAACILAKSPSDPLHRRLQPLRYLHDCSGCFRREQKSPGGIRTRRKGATFSWRTSKSGALVRDTHRARLHLQPREKTRPQSSYANNLNCIQIGSLIERSFLFCSKKPNYFWATKYHGHIKRPRYANISASP